MEPTLPDSNGGFAIFSQNKDRLEYFVISPDGQEYGPANLDVLKQWVAESRISHDTLLRPTAGGEPVTAGSVPGLITVSAPPAVPPTIPPSPNSPYTAYPRANFSQAPQYVAPKTNDGMGVIWGVVIRSILGLVLFFALHGIGVVFSGYALYYAFQAKQSGHRYGNVALIIAGLSTVAVVIGWILRISGTANI
jgi:hypothetical protein